MGVRVSDRRPTSSTAVETLDAEIDRIASLNIDGLRALWRETMGRPAPDAFSKDLIARVLAYRLQEQILGGVDPRLRRLLTSLAKPGAEPIRHLKIGSVIVREFEGKIHEVTGRARRVLLVGTDLSQPVGHRSQDHRNELERTALLWPAWQGRVGAD